MDDGDVSQLVMDMFKSGNARRGDAMLWMLRIDGRIGGYMLTQDILAHGLIEIFHGYMRPWARHNARICLEKLEAYAKDHGFRGISFVTRRDPNVYERWIRRFGYRRDYTAFIKEI